MSVSLWLSNRLSEGQAEPCLWWCLVLFRGLVIHTHSGLKPGPVVLRSPYPGQAEPNNVADLFDICINNKSAAKMHLSADGAVPQANLLNLNHPVEVL